MKLLEVTVKAVLSLTVELEAMHSAETQSGSKLLVSINSTHLVINFGVDKQYRWEPTQHSDRSLGYYQDGSAKNNLPLSSASVGWSERLVATRRMYEPRAATFSFSTLDCRYTLR